MCNIFLDKERIPKAIQSLSGFLPWFPKEECITWVSTNQKTPPPKAGGAANSLKFQRIEPWGARTEAEWEQGFQRDPYKGKAQPRCGGGERLQALHNLQPVERQAYHHTTPAQEGCCADCTQLSHGDRSTLSSVSGRWDPCHNGPGRHRIKVKIILES